MDYDKLKALRDSIHGDCYKGQDWEKQTIDELLADRAQSAQAVTEPADLINNIIRGCCESDAAEYDHPETICISRSDLRGVLECWIEQALPTPKAEPAPIPKYQTPHDFKNFHRQLCARFGYVHDEQFWWRDLVSLIEHIASKAQPAVEPVAEWKQSTQGHPYWPHPIPHKGVPLPDGWLDDYITDCAKLNPGEMPGVYFVQGVRFAEQHHWGTSPAPAPNALDAETVKKARRYDWLRDFHNGPEGVQDNLPYIAAGADNDLVWALCGIDADVGIDAALAAQSAPKGGA